MPRWIVLHVRSIYLLPVEPERLMNFLRETPVFVSIYSEKRRKNLFSLSEMKKNLVLLVADPLRTIIR